VHTFSVTLKTAGTQSITVTDTGTGTITGTQNGVTVNPAAATTLAVAGFPSPATAGVTGNVTATAKDAFGNTATGYRGTVHVTSSDGQSSLPADYAFTSGDAGVHIFSATLKTAGTQSITVTDTTTGTITGTQNGIIVNAAASTLTVAGFPSPVTAGVAGNVTITAKDAFGNTATGYRGTVQITSSDGQAGLPANYAFTSGDAGVHIFSATLKTAGTQSITGTDTTTGTITGTQNGITVNAASASTLTVAGFPSPDTAGVAHNVTVTAKDAFGNTATSYRGIVHFTTSDGQATLPANYTFKSGDAGVHTFSVTLKTAGTQSITATDTVTGTIKGTQSAITVNPAAAASFVISMPANVTHNVAFSFTVTVLDSFGNVATGYRGTLHFTSTDGSASLPANYKFTAADAGVHSFTMTFRSVGVQSLSATDTSNSTIKGSKSTNVAMADPPSSLIISPEADGQDLPIESLDGQMPAVPTVEVAAIFRDEVSQLEDGNLALLLTERIARTDPADSSQLWTHRISESLFRQAADEMLEDGYSEGSSSVAALAALFVLGLNPQALRRGEKPGTRGRSRPRAGLPDHIDE
jgi:hypothetical protein